MWRCAQSVMWPLCITNRPDNERLIHNGQLNVIVSSRKSVPGIPDGYDSKDFQQ